MRHLHNKPQLLALTHEKHYIKKIKNKQYMKLWKTVEPLIIDISRNNIKQ